MASKNIIFEKIEELDVWKEYWLHPDRTEDEFMNVSVRISCKGYFQPFFSLIKGIFYPYCVANEIVNLINEINQRFKVFVHGYGYSLGINEDEEDGWYKNYPEVIGVMLCRYQIYEGFSDIIENTNISYIGYDGEEIERVANIMSDEISNLRCYHNRIVDVDIPILIKDLDRLLRKLPKLKSVTIKIIDISEIPKNIPDGLIIRMI